MPANLTPQYLKAEEAYRRAATPSEELECLQVMLRELPKHKGTDKLQAELKQKISRARKEVESARATGKRAGGPRIPRQGAGRVVLIGAPNAGKSRLLAALTRATPDVAPYPFTTREPIPGMMPWEDVMVQLIDTPPITADFIDPAVHALIRGADLVLLVADLGADEGMDECRAVVDRLDQTRTRLANRSYLDEDDIGLSYTRTLLVAAKMDLADAGLRWELTHDAAPPDLETILVSAETGRGLDELRRRIYEALDVVRIYTKSPQQKEPDMERPFTIRRGGTLADIAAQIHKDLAKHLKFARVWGAQVHDGTVVKADYVLNDRDIVELHSGK